MEFTNKDNDINNENNNNVNDIINNNVNDNVNSSDEDDEDDEDDEKSDTIYQTGSSDYFYRKNGEEYDIGVKNYIFDNTEGYPAIISNYFIVSSSSHIFVLFATIVWEDIKYINDNYDPYDYDPDPVMVVYRDDLPEKEVEKYLSIIDDVCNKFYKPTTHYKHFNPKLPKIKLSDFTDEKTKYIADTFKELVDYYSSEDV